MRYKLSKFTRFKTKRSKRHYSHESAGMHLDPCLFLNLSAMSLMRIRTEGVVEARGAGRRGLVGDREVEGDARGGRRAPVGGHDSSRGGLRRRGHAEQRLTGGCAGGGGPPAVYGSAEVHRA
jgi:hypothetical protein